MVGAVVTTVPLAFGAAIGNRSLGLFCALGGLNTGLAISAGSNRTRSIWGSIALLGGTAAVTVATVTHHLTWLAVVATFVWATLWAMLRATGPAGTLVGFTLTAVFVIVSGQPGGFGAAYPRKIGRAHV